MAKSLTIRLEDDVWLQFKKKLLDDNLSAQQFFEEKVLEYLGKED